MMYYYLCIIDSLSVPTRALPVLEVRPTYGYSQVLHGLRAAQGFKCCSSKRRPAQDQGAVVIGWCSRSERVKRVS